MGRYIQDDDRSPMIYIHYLAHLIMILDDVPCSVG